MLLSLFNCLTILVKSLIIKCESIVEVFEGEFLIRTLVSIVLLQIFSKITSKLLSKML